MQDGDEKELRKAQSMALFSDNPFFAKKTLKSQASSKVLNVSRKVIFKEAQARVLTVLFKRHYALHELK